jgi:two-component system, LytTR family, response regulator
MKLRTLIADDEPLARERLKLLLAADEQIEIIAECRNGREVVASLKSSPIDLLFLDIQMPGTNGFDVIDEIGLPNMPMTVFVTAYNEYAVKAFEVHALDYLTKPVEPKRLETALSRIKEQLEQKQALMTKEQFTAILASFQNIAQPSDPRQKRILIRDGTKESFINVNDIEWIEAADYYCCLHVGTKTHMLRESIKQLEKKLDPAKFVRVHRSAIVNIDQVREIQREGRTEGWVVLTGGLRLRMSKVGWQKLQAVSQGE